MLVTGCNISGILHVWAIKFIVGGLSVGKSTSYIINS